MGADSSRPQASSPYDIPFDPRTLSSTTSAPGAPGTTNGVNTRPTQGVTSSTTSATPQSYSAVAVNSLANETGVRCICPRCRLMLMPPAATFRCPGCNQIIQLPTQTLLQQQQQQQQQGGSISSSTGSSSTNAQGNSSMSSPRSSGSGIPAAPYRPPSAYPQVQVSFGPGGHMHIVQQPGIGIAATGRGLPPFPYIISDRQPATMSPLELRVRSLLSKLPPNDPHSIFLRALLERLPRNPDGTLDSNALNELEHQINAALRGAPEALINAMPCREFRESTLPKNATNLEEHSSCTVCMSAYEEKEILRTLPCLHSFHRDCIDPWLKQNKTCPMCKMPIDADINVLLSAAVAKEEAAVTKRTV